MSHTDWDLHLQHVMLAYRSSVQETTGYTPHFLLTGREVSLPIDIMFGRAAEEPCSWSDYINRIRDRLQTVYEIVRHTTKSQQKRQKSNYERRLHGTPYKVGDVVWLYVPHTRHGQTSKLYKPWQGPYKAINKISDVTYRIQSVTGRKRQVVHFNRLKPCSQHLPDDRHDQTAEPSRRTAWRHKRWRE